MKLFGKRRRETPAEERAAIIALKNAIVMLKGEARAEKRGNEAAEGRREARALAYICFALRAILKDVRVDNPKSPVIGPLGIAIRALLRATRGEARETS